MWTPRLVALDLDGTLVDHDNTIAPATVAAVQAVVAAGVPVVISTGRGWHATREHVETLGLPPGPHVTSNGAVLVTYPPLVIDEQITFDVGPVVQRVLDAYPGALVAVEEVGIGYKVNRPFPIGELGGTVRELPLGDLVAEPATRIIIRDPEASEDDFIRLAEGMGLTGVSFSIGYTAWLDIAPQGVNKAVGLQKVVEGLGVDPADVLAIGDGRNDIEMLAWAGRGVALGEAPAEVQAAADHVTGLFSEEGTVAELRRWFA